MRRYLVMVLMLSGLSLCAHAQADGRHSRADKLFNLFPPFVNNVHTVHFLKDEKMIIELANLYDYDVLDNIEELLRTMMTDIAIYDSLPSAGNLRIDYLVTDDKQEKIMRFKRHPTDGDIFVKVNNETSRLLLDQDTIRITINKKPNDRTDHAHFYDFPVEVTFCLNQYSNINRLLADGKLLRNAIDTMRKAVQPRYTPSQVEAAHFAGDIQSTVDYYPYNTERKMFASSQPLQHGMLSPPLRFSQAGICLYVNMGATLSMNTLAPIADLGLTRINLRRYANFAEQYTFISLYASSVFFFSNKGADGYTVNDNYFINLQAGSTASTNELMGLNLRDLSIGAGYLAVSKGNYFGPATIKLFAGLRFPSGITVLPEVIITHNFRQVYPGLAVKLLGFKKERNPKP